MKKKLLGLLLYSSLLQAQMITADINDIASCEIEEEKVEVIDSHVININGRYVTAQEIIAQMTSDFSSAATTGFTLPIGHLNDKIEDNENSYVATDSTNTFKVSEDGVYQVTMNVHMSTVYGSQPSVGLWDNTAVNWAARVKDTFTAPKNRLQTYTLTTLLPLKASKTYSFRVSSKTDFTINYLNPDSQADDAITKVAVKRVN